VGSVRAGPTLRPAFAIVLAALLLTAISAAPASASGLSRGDRDDLQRYAADTWHSFDLLVDAHTGLPDDNVTAYLALDQGMVMAAAANALSGDSLRSFFAQGAIEQRIRPLLAMEQFTAG
jgi:hypothetical protein